MPPAKKRRIAAAIAAAKNNGTKDDGATDAAAAAKIAAANNGNNNIDGTLATKLLDQHRETLETLRANISDLSKTTSGDDNRASLFLSSTLALTTLKSLQRSISLQVESHASSSRKRRQQVEECSLVLENLNYERNYLEGEIGTMQGWKAGELERMACDELGIDLKKLEKKEEEYGEKKTGEEEEAAIDAYLLNGGGGATTAALASHRDPTNHAQIIHKLQSDLETRSSLVDELSQSRQQLKELKTKRDSLRGFLKEIPKKLLELERAGESLNNFFGGSGVWKDVLLADDEDEDENGEKKDGDEVMDGTSDGGGGDKVEKTVQAANLLVNTPSCNRTKRFQLAQSNLPSPLYVLFVQLTGYLDAWASLEKLGGAANNNTSSSSTSSAGEKKRKLNALDGFVGANGMNVAAVAPPTNESDDGTNNNRSWSVVLTLSPTDILPPEIASVLGKAYSHSRSASALIKIVFTYSEEDGVVYACVQDGDSNEGLLDNLFPGDDGSVNPNVSMSLLKPSEDDGEPDGCGVGVKEMPSASAKDGNSAKPYYWCQVLSGLNFPPPSSANILNDSTNSSDEKDAPFQIQTCTKAVFRQLLRHIRARKTLASVMEYLAKRSQLHSLPIHPAMRGGEDGSNQQQQQQSLKAKLQSWTEDTNVNKETLAGPTKCYVATIKRKSSTLKATVVIDTQNYPSQPPVWSLQNEDGSSGTLKSWGEENGNISSLQQNSTNTNQSNSNTPPLFDAALHRIECHVNQDLDKFISQDVETTYDWIVLHQLADIVSCWDEVMSAGEGGSGGNNNDTSMMGGNRRLRKGKDRKLMGFGERSPFYWYRNGL